MLGMCRERANQSRRAGVLLAMCCAAAIATAHASSSMILRAERTAAYHLTHHHPFTFTVRVAPGAVREVRIRQQRGSMLLIVHPPHGAPWTARYCQSGVGCVLPVTLWSARGGVFQLVLKFFRHCCKQRSADGTVGVSRSRPARAADRLRAQAERELARAEWAQLNGPSTAWPAARQHYRAAIATARRIDDPWVLRVALPDEARLDTYQLGHYHSALRLARAALQVHYGADLADREFALFAYGLVCQYRARYGAAIGAERQAVRIARRLGELQGEDIIEGNLAGVYEQIGRTAHALRSAHRSLAIARRIGDGKGVDYNLELIAELHSDRGDFNRALAYFQRALRSIHRYPYPDSQARCWIGLGELYDALKQPQQARSALLSAQRIATAAHDSTALFRVLIDLAQMTGEQGHRHAALAADLKSVRQAAALGLPRQHATLLRDLGRDYAALGEPAQAQTADREAIVLARHIGQVQIEASAQLALADAERAAGRLRAARAGYLAALALGRTLYSPLLEASAAGSLARLEWRQGALQRARRRIEQSLRLIGSVRSTLTTRHLRTQYFASEHGYYDLCVSILMALRARDPDRGYGRAALRWVERARARSLLDALHGAGRGDPADVPAGLRAQLHRIDGQLDVRYADWRDALADPSVRARRFAALRRSIAALRRRAATLRSLAGARSGRYAALADAHPVHLRALQQGLLGAHAALLEFWIGRQQGYAWFVRHGSVRTLRVPGAEQLVPEVRALRRALTARSRTVVGESLRARITRVTDADARALTLEGTLGAQLLPPVARLRGLATVYVVLDGPLFGVPIGALRPPGASAALIHSAAVLNEPSASVLHWLAAHQSGVARGRMVLFGDPVYRRDDPRMTVGAPRGAPRPEAHRPRWSAHAVLAHLARLPGTRRETLAIARLGGGRAEVHLGFAASVATVEHTDWRHVAVAHFAVHTLLDADHPRLSGLVLSLYHRTGRRARGVLWLRNIYALHMPVDLVVLSSCRTLGGRDVPGEGLVGLFRAFLLAGAHAVLGTLWRVQDRPTARLMRLFYTNLLQRRMTPAAALRAAQRAMMHSKRYGAPYYWAGFSLQGLGAPIA